MTVEEFLEIHPDEDVDLQVPEGRVLLDHGQVQRLLGGRPVIVCKTGVQDAQYMQAEDLLNQVVYLTHQTVCGGYPRPMIRSCKNRYAIGQS